MSSLPGTGAVTYVTSNGLINPTSTYGNNAFRPVLYLKSDVTIVDGLGKNGDEFILGL